MSENELNKTNQPKKRLQVTAAVIEKDGTFLCARKAEGKSHAGYWEFPGGKLEAGETPEECLIRELKEELNIECEVIAHFATNIHEYDDKTVELMAYFAEWVSGEIKLVDHDEIKWLPIRQLNQLKWTPADMPFISLLNTQK
jgi:8-oxo-dGTP diphosphatase